MCYDYFIVNGLGKKYGRRWKKYRQQKKDNAIIAHVSAGSSELELSDVEII